MEEQWHDMTVVGSSYEEQIEMYSQRRRHRPLRLGDYDAPKFFGRERGIGDWRPGPAPQK